MEGFNCQNMRFKGFHSTATKRFASFILWISSVVIVFVDLTWSVGLQVPGPPGASGQDSAGHGGVNGTTGLDVPFLVSGRGDLQDRDWGALVQLTGRRQHLCESLLAHASTSLQGAAQNQI